MRKDYIVSVGGHADETTFVESYWTSVWEQKGGPKGKIEGIRRSDEYCVISPYLARLPKNARILDGGCGLGDWVLFLSREGYDAVGIDLSRRTVQQLNQLFPDAAFVAGDIRNTTFPAESFDAYYSWGVFEHFEAGMLDCLHEAHRLLKPGGYLFMSVPYDNLRQSLLGVFGRPISAAPELRFYQYRFTQSELARELSIAGFQVMDVVPIHKRQGVLRSLHHELRLPYEWRFTRALSAALSPFLPGKLIGHMLLAIVRKPDTPSSQVPLKQQTP